MSDVGKYRTAHSIDEVLEVFRLEGMPPDELAKQRAILLASPPQTPTEPEPENSLRIFERACSICNRAFCVTAVMQDAVPADSPLNICPGCLNRLAVQDEERSLEELRQIFTAEWFRQWRSGNG